MKMIRTLPVVFALLAIFALRSMALETVTWPFNVSTNYDFDRVLVQVVDGEGKLVLLADDLVDGDIADYTNAVERQNLSLGSPQSVRLSQDNNLDYQSPGVFTSRILDSGGGGNEWRRITMSASSARYISDPSIGLLMQFDNNWQDQVSETAASVVGTSIFTTNAVQGTHAVSLNGSLYGTIPDNPLTGTDAFTVSVWLNCSAYVGFAGAIASSGSGSFRLRQRSVSERVLEVRVSTSGGTFVIQEPLPLNRWQHWVLTWDSSATGDGFPKLYIDGQLVETGVTANMGTMRTDGTLYVGADYEVPHQRGWKGFMDEVLVQDRALSAAEVARLYAGKSAVFESVNFQIRSGTNVAELVSRPFAGADGGANSSYVSGSSVIAAGAGFNTFDRFVQYRAELRSNKDFTRTPYLEGIRFEGTGLTLEDSTDYDFSRGQFESNTVIFTESGIRPFLGAAKLENGGYSDTSVFYSRTFDAGEPVTWQQLSWRSAEAVSELEFGLIALYHVNGNWNDSVGTFTVFDLSDADFTPAAKLGSRSARFNGEDNAVSGFGNFGVVRSMEFWIKADRPNTPVLALNNGNYLEVDQGRIRWVGARDASATFYVNGAAETTHLLSGWNHVAIVINPGMPVSELVVGEVSGQGFFAGDLDELSFYNRQLLTGEIRGHYVAGERIAAGGLRFQVADSTLTNFVGPGGSDTSYFLVSPFGDDPNLLGAIPAQQFFRYKIILDGDGNATPKVRSVRVKTAFPHGQTYTDDTAKDFSMGEFVQQSAVYGARIGYNSTAALGPENLNALTVGLTGLWHFDDDSWLIGERPVKAAFGSSGFGYGGADVILDPKVGTKAGRFNGSTMYLDSLGTVLPAGNSDLTVSFWFRTTSGAAVTLCSLDDTVRYFAFRLGSAAPGSLAFVVNDGLGEEEILSTRSSLDDDRWHHVVGVRVANQIILYVDGELVGAKEVPGLDVIGIAQELIVAKDPASAVFFAGSMDEIAVFNYALSESDIGALLGGTFRANVLGTFESEVIERDEPSIWQTISWVPDGPHSKGLTPVEDDVYQVGVWHFDATSGLASNAIPGNPHLGGTVVGAQRGVAGRFDNAFDFTGASDHHVVVGDDPLFDRSPEELSVSGWFFPRSALSRGFVDKTAAGNGFALTTDGSGRPEFFAGGTLTTAGVPLRLGRWNHLAGVFDGQDVRLYVNGEIAAIETAGGGTTATGADFWVGRSRQGRQSFDGLIDDVAFYSRALGAEEVLDHFRTGVASLEFQVRSATNTSEFANYVGVGNDVNTFYSEHFGQDSQGETDLSKFFQYRTQMGSESHYYAPELHSVIVEASGYPSSNPGISPTVHAGSPFLGHVLSMTHLRFQYPETDVKYQLSGDSGETNFWYYYSDLQEEWTRVDALGPDPYLFQANGLTEVQANLDTFYTDLYNATGGVFRFRALLHSIGEFQAGLDFVTVEFAEGRIVILQPNGKERGELSWLIGVPEEIRWEFGGDVSGTVRVQYSTDGGLIWRDPVTPPATAVPLTNQLYVWTTPAAASTQVLVRVTNNEDPTIFDVSDAPFELGVGYTIVDNNGGGVSNIWYIGETNIITWKKSFQIGAAHLEFSRDGLFSSNDTVRLTDQTVGPFAVNAFTWVIPTTNANLVGEESKLRAINAQGTIKDESDRSFLMAGAVVTAPRTGEAVKKDSEYSLQWRSAGMGSSVIIELQVTPGGNWEVLESAASNIDGENSITWIATNAPTDNARIRISTTNDVRARGITETFKIAAIELRNPLGHPDLAFSDVWLQGSTQTISWISGGAADRVNVLFSADGEDGPYMIISSNHPNVNAVGFTNELPWVVEPFPSDKARIRVEDASRPDELASVTPFDFQIAGLRVDWPNGGDTWDLGERRDAQWVQNALGLEGLVEISYDNQLTWNLVSEGFVLQNNSASYVPTNPTLSAFIRVTALAPPTFTNLTLLDTSDAAFSVAGIEILDPRPDVEYTIGTTNQIRFRIAATRDNNNAAEYYYSSLDRNFDFGNRLNNDSDVFQDGGVHIFNWLVGEDQRPSFGAQIQVLAGDYSTDSSPFTLRGIRFEGPVAAETLPLGNYDILWSHAGLDTAAKVDLSLSINGRSGPFDIPIASDRFMTDELFAWDVPAGLGPSTNAVLRIVVTAAPGEPADVNYTAFSRVFNLQGLRVTTPGAGDRTEQSTIQTIVWDAASGGADIDVYYSPDGGITDETEPVAVFVPSQDGTNAITWNVEMFRTPSTNGVLRLVSQEFPGLEGLSEPFMLQGIHLTRPTRFDIYATTDASSPISWEGVNGDGGVQYDIYYVLGNDTNRILIASNENGPTYNWNTPLAAVSDDIRIIVTDGKYSNTSDTFRVVSQPTVDVSSPEPGAFWKISQDYTVKWLRGGAMPNNFTVSYSSQPFVDTNEIATAGDITFNASENAFETTWNVPDSLGPTRIIVQHNTLSGVKDVSETFNIVGMFELLTPTNGVSVYALRPGEPVIWQTLGNVKFVDLYYSVSQQHEADSWVKINSEPIANNSKPYSDNGTDDDWVRSAFPWTVANARTTRAKLRVQEAAYQQDFDLKFNGPFGNSYGEFNIVYYTVYWDVYDAATGQRLDFVSVVDSSGWSESNLSSDPPNVIRNDYAWGTYNTELYREGFFDASILFWGAENTDISIPGPQSWTQDVAMVRSLTSPDVKVLANFSYDSEFRKFTIHSWVERGGNIIETPTSSSVAVYDSAGTQVVALPHDAFLANGIFLTEWTVPAQFDNRTVFFAKVEVELSGVTYSSGLTFTLLVPLGEALVAPLLNLADTFSSNLVSELGNVTSNLTGFTEQFDALEKVAQEGFTNLYRLGNTTTGLLASTRADIAGVSNQIVSVIEPKLDAVVASVTNLEAEVQVSSARLLTRPESVAFGSTNSLLYRTRVNYDPGFVQWEVRNGANTVIDSGNMTEIIPGIYEAIYTASWGVNTYKIRAFDPNADDSFVVRVVTYDPLEVPNVLALVTNELNDLESKVITMAAVNSGLTNLLPLVEDINLDLVATALDISSLTNLLLGVDFTRVEENIENLTNDLSVLANLDQIATQIDLLTNSIGTIQVLTNISEMVEDLTNAIAGFDAQDLRDIKGDLRSLTNRLSVIDWDQISALESDVSEITNTLSVIDTMTAQITAMTNVVVGVDFREMADTVLTLTNTLLGLDDVAIQIRGITNSISTDFDQLATELNNLTGTVAELNNVTVKLDLLTNAIGGVSLSVIDRNLNSLTNAIGAVDFDGLASNVDSLTNVFPGLTGLGGQINEITNILFGVDLASLEQGVQSITGVVASLGGIDSRIESIDLSIRDANFGDVDFEVMASSLVSISNILAGVGGLDAIAAEIGNISNSISQITALTNLSSTVNALGSALLPVDFDGLLADSAFTTNILGGLTSLDGLTTQLSGLSSSVTALASVTNLSSKLDDIHTRLNVDVDFAQLNDDLSSVTNTLASLNSLQDIAGQLSGLSSSVTSIAAITNVESKVDQLANELLIGENYRNLFRDMTQITNQLNSLSGLEALTTSISALSTSVTSIAGVTNIESQVSQVFDALRDIDFSFVQGGISDISNRLQTVDWTDIGRIDAQVQYLTNEFSAVSNLERIAGDLNNLTNAIAGLAGVTNIGAEVGNITNALNGLDWTDILAIRSMVQNVTNELGALGNINQIVDTLSDVTNSVAQLDSLTNMPTQVDALAANLLDVNFRELTQDVQVLTNAMAVIDWRDIDEIRAEVNTITNALGTLPDLPGLLAQITDLTNAFEDLQSVTNVSGSIDQIRDAIGNVRFETMAGDVQVLTNQIASLNLDIMQDILRDVGNVTNLLQTSGLEDLLQIREGVSDVTNILAGSEFGLWKQVLDEILEDTGVMTNLTDELQSLVSAVNPLLNLTNAIQQLSGITNLGAEVSNVTNALEGLDWADVVEIRGIVRSITNEIALLENLRGINDTISGVTNVLAGGGGAGGLTNLTTQVDDILDVVKDFNWNTILTLSTDVQNITNQVAEITGLEAVADTLKGLTNAIVSLSGVTNIGAEVANITNALSGIDWRDIADIQAKVSDITNTLGALSDIDELSVQMQGLTNSLAGLEDVADLGDKIEVVQKSVTNIVWSDVASIAKTVQNLTNDLGAVTSIGSSLTNLAGSIDAVVAVTNVQKSVDSLATTFRTASWSDVTSIQSAVQALSGQLQGISGVNLAGLDPTALGRIEQQLARIQTDGSSAVLADIERILGSATSGDGTIISRLNGISAKLNSIGTDSKNASTKANSAKSSASSASSAAAAAKQAIEDGNLDQAMASIRQMMADMRKAQQDLKAIPQDGQDSQIYERVRRMADTIETWAREYGMKYPFSKQTQDKIEESKTVAAGGAGEDGQGGQDVKDLSQSIQEMQISMEFLKKMIQEVAFQPVVEEALLAVDE